MCGNTNIFNSETGYSALIDLAMNKIGDKKVYWFNIYNNSNDSDIRRSIAFNNALTTARAKYPNLLVNNNLNWDASAQSSNGYLSNTGRGLSSSGISYLSTLVQQASNDLANVIQPGSYKEVTTSVPDFNVDQIVDAAAWLLENRAIPWSDQYGKEIGCEFFANRFSCGLGILGATRKYSIFTEEWERSVDTTLTTHLSAQAHFNAIKNKPIFYKSGTIKGDKPDYGYLVFWTGGLGDNLNLGHIGISIGNDQYIDQTGEIRSISGSTKPGGFPGRNYVYAGASSSWV